MGIFVILGFLAFSFYLWKLAREKGFNEEKIIDGFLLATIFSLAGARAGHIILDWKDFGWDAGKWLWFSKYPGFFWGGAVIGWIGMLVLLVKLDKFDRKTTVKEILGLYLFPIVVIYFKIIKPFMIKFPANVLIQIKEYLEKKRAETEHKLADLRKEDPFEDKGRLLDNATDDMAAHQKEGHERTQALLAQMNVVLIETRKALAKIKIGRYGICEKCGRMIDTDRLAAMPTATLCLTCEKKKEK